MKAIVFFIVLCSSVFAQDFTDIIPHQTTAPSKDLVWNKWDTSNFIILSIDKPQGLEVKAQIEEIRSDFLSRWSLKKSNYSIPCKLICVPNQEFLFKFFNLKNPHSEVRYDTDGKVSLCAIWIDFERIENLPSLVAQICLSDNLKGETYPLVIQRGVPLLENSLDKIKTNISNLDNLDCESIFKVDKKSYQSFNPQEKELYDRRCCLMCLFFRREFGNDLFSKFLSKEQRIDVVFSTYGFKDNTQLSKIFNNYSKNITEDIERKKIPDKYLNIK